MRFSTARKANGCSPSFLKYYSIIRGYAMRILYTGFDPFGGEAVNPAYEAVKRLPDTVAGAEVIRLEVPTEFARCAETVTAAIEQYAPDAVILVGQAGGRAAVTPEFVAINYKDARIPDNAGTQPVNEKIRPEGPAAYFSKLPVRQIAEGIRRAGIPSAVSYTAGTYVCNFLMYSVLDYLAARYPHIQAGFIHVPYAREQAARLNNGAPCLDIENMAQALCIAGEVTLSCPPDTGAAAGTVC